MNGTGPVTDVVQTPSKQFTLTPRNLDEAMKFADLMAKSDLVPPDYKNKPANILLAVAKGAEVGLSPFSALESICVIGGRATLWGDGQLGVVQASEAYEWHDEDQCTDEVGICTVKRKGCAPHTQRFSLADAKRAGYLSKPGSWQTHTRRMLQLRARSFALRDQFSDALKGLDSAEEAIDRVEGRPEAPPEAAAIPQRTALVEKLKSRLLEPVKVEEEQLTLAVESKGDTNLFEGYVARMRQTKDVKVIREEQKLGATDKRLSVDQMTAINDLAVELLSKMTK